MRVHSIQVNNYRPFSVLQEIKLGPLATIIGQNDVGKSNILRALQLFFDSGQKIGADDVHDNATAEEDVIIEVAFTTLPEKVKLEEDVETTLQDEMLLDPKGFLRIRKTYPRNNLTKFTLSLITHDFDEDSFAGLPVLKEKDLNEKCSSLGIDVKKSGRGITNKSKRDSIRAVATDKGCRLVRRELSLTSKDDFWKKMFSLLPEFHLFETDTRLGVGETSFQSQFRPIIKAAAEHPDVLGTREILTGQIAKALQGEVNTIFKRLQQHTDTFVGLTAKPKFSWDRVADFEILGKDIHGCENSLDRRGSGIRRLLMVAFFQYMAEKGHDSGIRYIFSVEEPENCLHPGLQRELVNSFRRLADEGYQIIITSHSPVFTGASPIEDLALVVRSDAVARAIQAPELELSDVADALGVEPADQITGYSACVYVEGPDDIIFWGAIADKLKESGHLEANFNDKKIGFVMSGGDNLKHWIDLRAMKRLNRRFGVVVDSDRKGPQHNIPGRKLNWKRTCNEEGGKFFILRKREIENYLHSAAIERSGRSLNSYDDFTDMKALFGNNVFKIIRDMSSDEILEMDSYDDGGEERHELLDIAKTLLSLSD